MKRPFLAWPGWAHLRFAWPLSLLSTAWFVFVYGGCNWITAHRAYRVQLALPGEVAAMPFVPGMSFFYMSVYLLFVAAPFVLRERREFGALAVAQALSIFCGGVGFLLFPSRPAYALPAESDLGVWAGWYDAADWLNLDYNMAPSLHVALSVGCVAAFVRYAPAWGRALLWGWAGAIALSTLLTHQHYIVDAVSGWALGWAAQRWAEGRIRSRFAAAAPAGATLESSPGCNPG